jgi:DNA processing protein
MTATEPRPLWWTPGLSRREILLALAATPGSLPATVATRLGEGRDPVGLLRAHSPHPDAVATRLEALGVRFLVPGDDDWPLAATPPDPPCAWLFVAGPAPPAAVGSIAVVGGRRASPLRRAAARALGAGLSRAGWCVVSGGAVGVDAAAHAGALQAGGHTVVVLGCGLDVPYPRANTGLFAEVRAAGGSLVSEHPPGSPPRAANFLPRNRLIAALSAAVVVVEAAEDSGSLSTARAAGSRGVGQVLVLPGAPWDAGAAGCNQLIRDGAILVRSLTDIFEELGAAAATTDGASMRPWSGLPHPARIVLSALLDGQVLGPGRLAAATDLPPADLDAALLDLELAGLIRRTAAGIQAIALPPGVPAPTSGGRSPPDEPTHPTPSPGDDAANHPEPSTAGTHVTAALPEAASRRPGLPGIAGRPPASPNIAGGGPAHAEARGPPRFAPPAGVLEWGGWSGDDDGDGRQP